MVKRNYKNDDIVAGLNFIFSFPARFSCSSSIKTIEDFELYCKNNKKSKSKILRNFIFDFFSVKNEQELLSKNENIRKKVNELLNEIKDEMGVNDREFSAFISEKIKNLVSSSK